MCGIVGYIGNNSAQSILVDGLKSMEYRGYDSAGLALDNNNRIDVFKAEGKLNNLLYILKKSNLETKNFSKGIGHIRWATHGAPTIDNAHPHQSNDGKLALVHNGIIENFKELKDFLTAANYLFFSQTDTEVATNLIDYEYKRSGSLEQAVTNAIKKINGAFAFCIMHANEPDKIIAVRKNAPLIVGIGDNENFIASDIPAIIGKANKIIYLDDNELAIVTKETVEVKDFNGKMLNKKIENILFEPESMQKLGYKHFMLKEINEQPDIIRKTLNNKIINCSSKLDMDDLFINLERIKKIEIIACGTSLHAAHIAKQLFEDYAKIPVNVEAASEYIYKNNLTDKNTLVIGISQSGETADTITAVKQAKEKGAQLLIITNRTDSSIVRYADNIIPLQAGIEVSVAATKSYTAQLIALYLLAIHLAEINGSDQLQEIKQGLLELPTKLEQILSNTSEIKKVAKKLSSFENFIFIARGINIATAMEGALKLKEISYINASAYPAGELKHGPIALLDKDVVILSILIKDSPTYAKILSNCEEAKARNAKLVTITDSKDPNLKSLFDEIIYIPQISETLSPILSNLPLQLLSYYVADDLGREIDQPRNLAKSVTVE